MGGNNNGMGWVGLGWTIGRGQDHLIMRVEKMFDELFFERNNVTVASKM